MSIHLYKHGDTHTIDGHKCEIVTCEIETYHELKAAGCVDDVRDLYPDLYPAQEPEAEPKIECVHESQHDEFTAEQMAHKEPAVEATENQIDLLDPPEFLTQKIPVDAVDKSKKK